MPIPFAFHLLVCFYKRHFKKNTILLHCGLHYCYRQCFIYNILSSFSTTFYRLNASLHQSHCPSCPQPPRWHVSYWIPSMNSFLNTSSPTQNLSTSCLCFWEHRTVCGYENIVKAQNGLQTMVESCHQRLLSGKSQGKIP